MNSYLEIEVLERKNNSFLEKMFKNQINIYKILKNKDKIIVTIKYDDYKKFKKLCTIYNYKVIKVIGIKKYKDIFKQYKIIIILFIISIFMVYILSKLTFFINISPLSIKEDIIKELKENNVTLYSFEKSYSYYNAISKKIILKRNDIEWLEINKKGLTLYVEVKLKKTIDKENNNDINDIVANENGYIQDMYIKSGSIIKNKGDYVNKGEVIVSGAITRNDNIVGYTKSEGEVYATIWKKVIISMPFEIDKEEIVSYTKIISFKIFNLKLPLVKIKTNKEKNKTIYKGVFLNIVEESFPIKKIIKEKNTEEETYNLLLEKAEAKIKEELFEKEYIIKQNTLKKTIDSDKMYLEIFFEIYKNIASKRNINISEGG